jgi:hypothetical protein
VQQGSWCNRAAGLAVCIAWQLVWAAGVTVVAPFAGASVTAVVANATSIVVACVAANVVGQLVWQLAW